MDLLKQVKGGLKISIKELLVHYLKNIVLINSNPNLISPRVLIGWPRKGVIFFLCLGALFFILGVIFLNFGWTIIQNNSFILSVLLFIFPVTGFIFIIVGLLRTRPNRIEFDNIGLRFIVGKKTQWEISWGEICGLGTSRIFTHVPINYILIRTRNRTLTIDDEHDFGPTEKLKEIFCVILTTRMQSDIFIDDALGWTKEITMPVSRNIPPQRIEQKWFNAKPAFFSSYLFFFVGSMSTVAGFIMSIIISDKHNICILSLVGFFILWGVMLIGFGWRDYQHTFISLSYNKEGIIILLLSGKNIRLNWHEINKVSYNNVYDKLIITSKNNNWTGYFPHNVIEVVCRKYVEVTKNKVIIINSPI